MHPIIALWAHPRSMSTAIERVMRERGDLACFHEPFLYDYYVARKVRDFPHFEVDPGRPVTYDDARAELLAAAERGPVFFKDMSYYASARLFEDLDFADHLTHAFLIRDPRKSLVSYHKLDPDLTLEEIGLEAQWRHFEWARDRYGMAPFVIQAEAVQADTRGAMGAFWQAVGLPYIEDAFSWDKQKPPEDWQGVTGWHGDAMTSGGIRKADDEDAHAAFEAAAESAPKLRDLLAHHLPFYEKLKAAAG